MYVADVLFQRLFIGRAVVTLVAAEDLTHQPLVHHARVDLQGLRRPVNKHITNSSDTFCISAVKVCQIPLGL